MFVFDDAADAWRELESFRAMEQTEEWRAYADRLSHVQTIQVDPHADRRLYAGVEVGGAYASEDRGRSWQVIGDGLYEDIHVLAVDPRAGSRMYAATGRRPVRERGPRPVLAAAPGRGRLVVQHRAARAFGPHRKNGTLSRDRRREPRRTWTRHGAKARLHVSRDAGGTWKEASVGALRYVARTRTRWSRPIQRIPREHSWPREAAACTTARGCGEYWVRIHRGETIRTLLAI